MVDSKRARGTGARLAHVRSGLLASLVLAMLTSALPAGAQQGAPAAAFNPEELEQIAAPIALYPDPLLAQILMASTYPLEVVQAARFVKDNPNLAGDQLNEKLKEQTWDDSVKSLVSFPQALSLMNEKLDWVQKLGDAFLAQQKELLDAVQRLRARAHAQGTLKTTAEQTVTVEPAAAAAPAAGQPPAAQTTVVQEQAPTVITIEPANPQVVYVPSYNPTTAYGAWPYPTYPPYSPYPPGYAFGTAALSFGLGMAVGAAVWGDCDWNNGHADVNVNNYNSYSQNVNRSDVANERVSHYQQGQGGNRGNRSEWKHNPENRRGVQYRDAATQQRYNRPGAGTNQAIQSREAFRGRADQGRQDLSRGGAGSLGGPQGGARAQQLGGAQGGARGGSAGGGQGGFGGNRGGAAFQGMGSGSDARASSNRGQSSRQSIGAGGGTRDGSRTGGGGGRSGGGRGGGRR